MSVNFFTYVLLIIFRYITSIEENAKEGTKLQFDGELDKVEDLDKVKQIKNQSMHALYKI